MVKPRVVTDCKVGMDSRKGYNIYIYINLIMKAGKNVYNIRL